MTGAYSRCVAVEPAIGIVATAAWGSLLAAVVSARLMPVPVGGTLLLVDGLPQAGAEMAVASALVVPMLTFRDVERRDEAG